MWIGKFVFIVKFKKWIQKGKMKRFGFYKHLVHPVSPCVSSSTPSHPTPTPTGHTHTAMVPTGLPALQSLFL